MYLLATYAGQSMYDMRGGPKNLNNGLSGYALATVA